MYVGCCLLLHGADVSNPSVNYSEMTAALGTVPHEKLGEVKGATPGFANGVNDANQGSGVDLGAP